MFTKKKMIRNDKLIVWSEIETLFVDISQSVREGGLEK